MGRCVRLMEGAFPPGGACISAWPARGRLDALSVSCGVPWAMCMHAGAQPACAPLCVRTALPVACLLCGGARGWSPSASGPARPASSSVRLHDGASRVACGRSGERPGLAARSQFYAWVGTSRRRIHSMSADRMIAKCCAQRVLITRDVVGQKKLDPQCPCSLPRFFQSEA